MSLLQDAIFKFAHRAMREGYNVTRWKNENNYLDLFKEGRHTLVKVWAVAKPSDNPKTGDREFGIRATDVSAFIDEGVRFDDTYGLQNTNLPKLIFYIQSCDEFMKITLDAAVNGGRVLKSNTIHYGGTVFIKVGDCIGFSMPSEEQVRLDVPAKV